MCSNTRDQGTALMDRILTAPMHDDMTIARSLPLVLVFLPSPIDAGEKYDISGGHRAHPAVPAADGYPGQSIAGSTSRHSGDSFYGQPFATNNALAISTYRGGDLNWKATWTGARAARFLSDSLVGVEALRVSQGA
jgi:hypothetical protein